MKYDMCMPQVIDMNGKNPWINFIFTSFLAFYLQKETENKWRILYGGGGVLYVDISKHYAVINFYYMCS